MAMCDLFESSLRAQRAAIESQRQAQWGALCGLGQSQVAKGSLRNGAGEPVVFESKEKTIIQELQADVDDWLSDVD